MTKHTSDVSRQYEDQVIEGTQETQLARENLRGLRTTVSVANEVGEGLGRG
jgi:hypothetical protein